MAMILVSKTQQMLHRKGFVVSHYKISCFFNTHVSILPCFETILLHAVVQL